MELLEFIRKNFGDLKNFMSRGGKRYYNIFVDDYIICIKVYFFCIKDEAEDKFLVYKYKVEN